MKYQLVDHDDGDKKYVLDWQESTPPDDEAIQGILAENRKQPKPQAAPQAPEAPKPTELPPGAIPFDPNAKFQPEAVEHVAAKDKATADLLGKDVPLSEKPLEQQIAEEYKTPTLEVPRQITNQYRVKGTTPGSIEWFDKLPDEHKDAVKPYMSTKDQQKVEGMEQGGAGAFVQSSANAASFGMLNKQGAALAEVKHPNLAAAGQLAGSLVDFMPEGAAASLAVQLPRIAARAKTYGKVGGVIAHAVTAGTTMGLDGMMRNKDDLASPIPEVAEKAKKNVLNQIEYGVLAVAPAMAKVPGWANRVSQAALSMLFSAKDDPEALKKENVGHTIAAAITMGILAGKGHEAKAGEAPKLDEATGQPIADKPLEYPEEFNLDRYAPKPEGKEVLNAEKSQEGQKGETLAETGITTPVSSVEKKDVQGSQAQAAPVLTPEQRVQLDELRKQNAPPPPVDPDKPEPHPDQGTWDKNNSAIDFFRNNGYIYDEEKKRYVPENIPGDAEKYWASFGRLGPEYTRPDVDDKETRAKSRSLGREAGQSEEALTKSGRQAPLPGSEAGGVAPVEGQGRSGEPVGASQPEVRRVPRKPEVRRVPRKPQTWTGNPEVDREAWSANLKSKLREEILNQPGGKQQWDYVMGKKTRDKNNNPIHYTNLTSKLLHDTYDYYETTEGRQGALKILGKSENPFSDFEDVASVAQGSAHPWKVNALMAAERKNPTTPGEKKMTDAEAQEYERYMRAQDEAVGAHRVDLGGGDVAFAKKPKKTVLEQLTTPNEDFDNVKITDQPMRGFLLPSGEYLGIGEQDHRNINGMVDYGKKYEEENQTEYGGRTKKMYKIMRDAQAIRWLPETNSFQAVTKPTRGQLRAIEDFVKEHGSVEVELGENGKTETYTPDNIYDLENNIAEKFPGDVSFAKIGQTDLFGGTKSLDQYAKEQQAREEREEVQRRLAERKGGAADASLPMFRDNMAAGEGGQTSLFAKQNQMGLYSNAEAAVDKINMPKAPADQWAKMLSPEKGIGTKADEMKWIGLDDFLKEKGNQSVSKQEIQDFIDQNKIKLVEVRKGKEPFKSPLTEEESDRMEELGLMENHTSEEADEYNKLSKKFKLEKDRWLEAGEGTKFSSYQTPGGENYREVLLTLPSKPPHKITKGRAFNQLTDTEKQELDKTKQYHSSHWDEPNVLAHVRLNDRTDAEGKKVLFVEEIQSDWHQEGRKKGYKFPKNDMLDLPEGYVTRQRNLGGVTLFKGDEAVGTFNSREAAIDGLNQQRTPAAPFSKTWHELAFKRILREAAEKGYDKVAWTTSEQQAARYDLSKHVDAIHYSPEKQILMASKGEGERVIDKKGVKPEDLEGIIGKEAAKKIMEQETDANGLKSLMGEELKVGGEGMKGFYDKILVDYANKYGKKWGAKVSDDKVPVGPENKWNGTNTETGEKVIKDVGKYETVHSMDITPAMRESVMREGQPMFAKGSAGKPKYTAKTLQPILNRIAPKGLVIAVDGEEGFPQNVRDKIKAQRFEGQIMGTYDGLSSKLFINAEHMPNEASIRKYVKHELTHLGLRISLGKQIEPIYKTLYGKYKNFETGKAIISNYFPDGFHPEEYWNHKITFVDEVLAKLGETNVDPGFFRRMVARIKVMLNSRFPGMKFSDKDVRAMIANAHRDAEKFGKKLEDLPEGHQLQYDADTRKWAVLNEKGETVNEDADRTKAIAFAKKSRDEVDPTEKYHDPEAEKAGRAAGVRYTGSMKADPEHGIPEDQHWYNDDNAKTPTGFFIKAGEDLKAKRDESRARNEAQERKKQTETPEFKKWFGDSKVVDGDGKPLVVYHGTNSEDNFSEFDKFTRGRSGTAAAKKAFFFSNDPDNAANFSGVQDRSRLIPAYISLKNPLISDHSKYTQSEMLRKGHDLRRDTIQRAIRQGKDGVIFTNTFDYGSDRADVYAVFEPTQIKSATGNRGTFDPNNPDIRFAKKEPTFGEGNDASKIPGYRGDRNIQRPGETDEDWRKRTANAEDKTKDDAAIEASEKKLISDWENLPKTPPRSLPSKPMAGIFGALKALHTKVTSIEGVYSPFKKTLLEWDSKNQQLAQKATNAVNYVKKFVPDKARRDAISVYREAGGDKAVLRKWAQETPQGKLQGKYVLALNLTDQEKKVADGITELYQKLLERGQKYGLIDQARMNYVTHLVQRGDAVGKEAMKGLSSGKLVSAFKFGRESDFPTIHDAEQALGTNDFGQTFRYKVATSDAADLMGIYISEMEKTINTKDLIKNLTEQKAKDGRPLAVPAGAVKSSVNGETGDKTLVVKPREVDKDYSDYRGVDHYALNDWKWIGKDTGGNPVTIKGDLVLHPDIVKHVKNVLGSSGIRDWYNNPPNVFQAIPAKILKTVDNWQNNTKQAMFSVSAFHWVQEGTHAIGHRVNPFKVPTIDLEGNKDHIDAADHGLKLKGDYDGMAAFREGLGVGPLMYKIPGIGKLLEKSSEPLFTWYIPGLKYKTYEHILGRNMTRFEKEIQAGKVTADDVKYVSAKQANAAYGHLNYVDMGRNPTIQHLFRMFTLAPDFLEARTRFAAQAVGGTISKGGREQLEALAVLAVTQYVACRIINKLADDDYHMDQPFKVVIGTKTYGLRSVPGDLYHLYQNHNQFVQGRISPVLGKSVEHLLTGRDYRGLPQSDLSFLKEVATSALPISLRAAIPGMSTNKDVNAYDSFLSATGIGVSRYSPLTCMYDMVDKWKASQGITKQEAVYTLAKFRDLRNAVQDGEEGGVYKHWDELLKGGKIHTTALKEHFRQSLFRPFTGSEKTEKAFRRSLSPEDRKIYDVAVMDKQRTWKNFLKIMGERPVQDKGQEKTVQSDTTQAQEGENHEP